MSNPYCDKDMVKDRMLIVLSDTSYNDALDVAIEEASRLVDVFLKPYLTDPEPPLETPDDQIKAITADFAASMFKRRMLPDDVKIRGALQPDMINEIDSSGWFAQGVRKIEQYIKSYYTLAQTVGNTAHNPDIYLNLFKSGIITGKEARAFINTASAIALTKIDTITRTETIIRTEDVTKTEYNTKKQKSFSFIKSDGNDGYEDDTVLPD
jgi:hypothetical protein